MKGKILSYDKEKGIGKVIIKNEGVKLFNIDNWLDYNITPSVGLEIEFSFDENNSVVDILSSTSSELLIKKLNQDFHYVLPEDLKIQEDVSLNYCLEEFFTKFKKIALKYKDLLNNAKNLPYKKIKRFIFTAYNNLLEIDVKVNDKRLRELKSSLDEIEYYYDTLLNETKNPIYVILEKLVLNKQENYQVLKKRFESNKVLITESTKNANLLELKIDKLKNNLKKLNPKSDEYNTELKLLKAHKKKYVDLIDMMQNLKDENSKTIKDIIQFENVYKEIFEKFFNQEVSILLNILQKELDVLSYNFDTVLWENAKKSKQIQHFFKEAKIEGSYSTKTFMKYYLKNLKSDKMNIKDVELMEIFNELKVFSKSVIIYDKYRNRARELSVSIENLDHDTDVKIFDNFKDFIFYIKDNSDNLDIVILEVEDNTQNVVNKILPIIEKIGVKIVKFSDSIYGGDILKSENLQKDLKHIL